MLLKIHCRRINVMPPHSCDTTKTMLLSCLDDHGMFKQLYTHQKETQEYEIVIIIIM